MRSQAFSARSLCEGAAVAALYVLLTLFFAPISFGSGGAFQLRVAEALTVLPVLTPAAVPGLFAGCLIANLISGAPLPDIVFGSLATLLSAVLTRRLRKSIPAAVLAPVVCNTVIVGVLLSRLYGLRLWYAMLTVAPGEAAACCLMGIPFLKALQKTKIFLSTKE